LQAETELNFNYSETMSDMSQQPTGEYWQPELETMPRERSEQLQVEKLNLHLQMKMSSQ
jgi:hypothetical protein